MQPLITVGENLWVHEDTMTFIAGTQLRLRMTVAKLADGGLWVHSPTKLTVELKSNIDTLGPVDFIVGPSNGHNLWLLEWHSAYPKAELHVSAGIPKKIGLQKHQVLDENFDNCWSKDFAHIYLDGASFFNESVFLHLASKSLIVTDLIQNHSDPKPSGLPGLFTRLLFEPLGFKGICVAPPLKWGFMIKNKQSYAAAIRNIQDWDFERIIVTHGDIIEKNAKQTFSELCNRFLT